MGNSNSTISNIKDNEKIIFKDDIKPIINTSKNISSELSAIAKERDPSSEMIIKAFGNSWIEIEDIDGHIVMTRLMRPGETYVVPKKSGLTFNTGNAGGLSLSYGNITIPSLGKVGEIISARPLNIEAFKDKKIIIISYCSQSAILIKYIGFTFNCQITRPYRNIERRKSRKIKVGNILVGGDAPISVQTMTNTLTTDINATIKQIEKSAEAGADIVRVSCPDQGINHCIASNS